VHGDGGGRETAGVAGDFNDFPKENAGLVAVDGWEIGEGSFFSSEVFEKPLVPSGVQRSGIRLLRNSVYASGGVIGVAHPSSRLTSLTVRVFGSACFEGQLYSSSIG
jgi:hypothetical protein